jgi:hypothetical protein
VPALTATAFAVVGLVGCTAPEAAQHQPVPAVAITNGADKSAPKTLTLTADALRRLELSTVVVEDPATIPYAAVVYDKKGKAWVYSNPKERTFTRLPVVIQSVQGEFATLSAGPPRFTRVVTQAAIKLYGAENGVGGGH